MTTDFDLYEWAFEEVICGCGRPEEALGLLHDLLRWLRDQHEHSPKIWTDRSAFWDRQETRLDGIVTGPARWAMWYWMDHLDLIEHGSSVPGWLTSFGETVLAALDADEYEAPDGDRDYRSVHPEVALETPKP